MSYSYREFRRIETLRSRWNFRKSATHRIKYIFIVLFALFVVYDIILQLLGLI